MDLAVKNKENKIIGYIINVDDILKGRVFAAETYKDYNTVKEVESFNIPENFKCCAMDATTINQLILMNPKI